MTIRFYNKTDKRDIERIQMFDASDVRAHCPDCGRPVEMPTKQQGLFIVPAPIAYDSDGPIFIAACAAGHEWVYQAWDDTEIPED